MSADNASTRESPEPPVSAGRVRGSQLALLLTGLTFVGVLAMAGYVIVNEKQAMLASTQEIVLFSTGMVGVLALTVGIFDWIDPFHTDRAKTRLLSAVGGAALVPTLVMAVRAWINEDDVEGAKLVHVDRCEQAIQAVQERHNQAPADVGPKDARSIKDACLPVISSLQSLRPEVNGCHELLDTLELDFPDRLSELTQICVKPVFNVIHESL